MLLLSSPLLGTRTSATWAQLSSTPALSTCTHQQDWMTSPPSQPSATYSSLYLPNARPCPFSTAAGLRLSQGFCLGKEQLATSSLGHSTQQRAAAVTRARNTRRVPLGDSTHGTRPGPGPDSKSHRHAISDSRVGPQPVSRRRAADAPRAGVAAAGSAGQTTA